ncbi:hypothetical protein Golax_019787, partial [Gossypium laxum]|nr:hypothetical protein [Gossypium laxum]
NAWFNANVKPASARVGTIDPALAQAEAEPKVIKVVQGGGGDFDTITKAIESVPTGNTKRVIISIGPGAYREKIKIERTKPFITLIGDPKNGKMEGEQGVSLRVSGDKAAFYNCKIIGFRNTLCDDKGNHFFMNCYIRGTVDFIFGNGKSLYLETELYVEADKGLTAITAQERGNNEQDRTGFSFVQCKITGTAQGAYLGRARKSSPRVVFAFSDMSNVVNPEGWSHDLSPERAQTVFYGEYKCSGPGAAPAGRVPYSSQLTETVARQFLTLGFVDGSKWLLPPPNVQ